MGLWECVRAVRSGARGDKMVTWGPLVAAGPTTRKPTEESEGPLEGFTPTAPAPCYSSEALCCTVLHCSTELKRTGFH